jgi:hypothetical protein
MDDDGYERIGESTLLPSSGSGYPQTVWYKKATTKKVVIIISVLILLIVILSLSIALPLRDKTDTSSLAYAVSTSSIMDTLSQFEGFANKSGGSRSVVSNGYVLSAEYIENQLEETGVWSTLRQYFDAPVYTEYSFPTLSLTSPYNISFQYKTDFLGMRYGGNGSYHIIGGVVFNVNATGCDSSNYDGLLALSAQGAPVIALINGTGPCISYDKALLAQKFNASAVLFYSSTLSSTRVRAVDWTPASPTVGIPTLSITNTVAQLLQKIPDGVQLSLTVNNSFTVYNTFNIIATYKGKGSSVGNSKSIVAIGSHLDSVPAGPGINDDGSGSAINLELALKWPTIDQDPENLYQAMWWGSEEEGLVGSRYFVRQLNQTGTLSNYALYINMDMLASPNYILKILDGNTTADPSIRAPSSVITQLFQNSFEDQVVSYKLTAMNGGSDFLPFIEAGIPSSGLLSGAGEIKTPEDRAIYGGLANAPLDPCYHLPCDTVLNINQDCLNYNTQAVATVLQELLLEKDLQSLLYPQPSARSSL